MLLLVDYSSMLYRAYHSTPSSVPMHGVHGFLNMLARVIQDRKPTHLALATDDDWRPQFRVDRLPMYKAQRVSEEIDPVSEHELYGREVSDALGLAVVGAAGFEAEDIIATIAETATGPVEVLSGDRDLFDLVRDPDLKVLYPMKGGLQQVTETWIHEKYGIPGRRYGDFAILRGDPSDGLPGVPGIGEKTAAQLISQYGSLDALLNAPGLPLKLRLKLQASQAYLEAAQAVVLPVRDVPLPPLSLELPRQIRRADLLQRAQEQFSLGNALARIRGVLGL